MALGFTVLHLGMSEHFAYVCLLVVSKRDSRDGLARTPFTTSTPSLSGYNHAGVGVEAMKAVAKAYQGRSLQEFQSALAAYKEELVDDSIVHLHLSRLYDTLLEQNLCRLIEPYSRVEIEYLAKLIKLPTSAVLTKLSQVIDFPWIPA